jgi:hypothetical protein
MGIFLRSDGLTVLKNPKQLFGEPSELRTQKTLTSSRTAVAPAPGLTLPAADTLKRYSKTLEYEYRVKTAALDTLKRYSIPSLTLYLE